MVRMINLSKNVHLRKVFKDWEVGSIGSFIKIFNIDMKIKTEKKRLTHNDYINIYTTKLNEIKEVFKNKLKKCEDDIINTTLWHQNTREHHVIFEYVSRKEFITSMKEVINKDLNDRLSIDTHKNINGSPIFKELITVFGDFIYKVVDKQKVLMLVYTSRIFDRTTEYILDSDMWKNKVKEIHKNKSI